MKIPRPDPSAPKNALVVLATCVALAGCGGGGGGSSASTATEAHPGASATTSTARPATPGGGPNGSGAEGSAEPGPPASAFVPKHHHDSGGGSAQFIVKDADNSVQEFGAEASEAELHRAATALHGFLDARAERNSAAACTYLSKATKQGFGQLAASKQPMGCPAALAALSAKVPTQTLREAAQADVGALRVEGESGFIVHRGAHGVVTAVSMAREGGAWKVASLNGVPLS